MYNLDSFYLNNFIDNSIFYKNSYFIFFQKCMLNNLYFKKYIYASVLKLFLLNKNNFSFDFILKKKKEYFLNIKNILFYQHFKMSLNFYFFKKNIGVVISVFDAVAVISGLRGVKNNELIFFFNGVKGLALSLDKDTVSVLIFGDDSLVSVGQYVNRSGFTMRVGVGYNVLGRIINPLGEVLDNFGNLKVTNFWAIERKAPGIFQRDSIKSSLQTGIKIIDALIPIGHGQRELIIGDRKSGKTTIAVDTILNQKRLNNRFEESVFCFYAAIGKRMADVKFLVQILKKYNSFSNVSVIIARASDSAALQYIAPFVATTLAEYFTYRGNRSLVIYDDLSRHAESWRQISLLLKRPAGREAYPGDIFYLHSRLLERSCKLSNYYCGGSLTALPIVETLNSDIAAFIPTNIISITDGQIFMSLAKQMSGVRPAIDLNLSVSRIGSAVQSVALKSVVSSLKTTIIQYNSLLSFKKLGGEVKGSANNALLVKGALINALLQQVQHSPVDLRVQIILFNALENGLFSEFLENCVSFDIENYLSSLNFFLENSVYSWPFASWSLPVQAWDVRYINILFRIHFYFHFTQTLSSDMLFNHYFSNSKDIWMKTGKNSLYTRFLKLNFKTKF